MLLTNTLSRLIKKKFRRGKTALSWKSILIETMRIQNGNVFLWKGSLIENGIYQSKWEFPMKQNLVVKIGFARKWSELDPMWLVYKPCMLLGSHWGCRLICPTIIGSKSNNWTFRKAFGCAPTVTGPWRLSVELWSNLSNNWRPCITPPPSFHKPHKTWKTL